MSKLHIGIPTYGKPDSLFAVDSLPALTYHIGRRHPEITDVSMQRDVRTYRQEARNAIVLGAREAGASHLLMLDDDHVFGGQHFSLLWAAMADNPEIQLLSGLYFTRGELCAPCIFRLTGAGTVPLYYYPDNSVYAVDVVGFGFLLIDMRLFDEVTEPWFNLAMGFGEDAAFCTRLKHYGKKVWVHTGCKIGHILETPRVITEEHYFSVRRQIEDRKVAEGTLPPSGGNGRPSLEPGQPGVRSWWRPTPTRKWNEVSDLEPESPPVAQDS